MEKIPMTYENVLLSDLQQRYFEVLEQLKHTERRADEAKKELERQIISCQETEDYLIGLIPIIKLNGTLEGFGINPVSLPKE